MAHYFGELCFDDALVFVFVVSAVVQKEFKVLDADIGEVAGGCQVNRLIEILPEG